MKTNSELEDRDPQIEYTANPALDRPLRSRVHYSEPQGLQVEVTVLCGGVQPEKVKFLAGWRGYDSVKSIAAMLAGVFRVATWVGKSLSIFRDLGLCSRVVMRDLPLAPRVRCCSTLGFRKLAYSVDNGNLLLSEYDHIE